VSSSPYGTVSGRGLGGELRVLREERGLKLRRVANELGWPASKLSRIETGKLGIRAEDVASLLVVYGITGAERQRLLEMAQRTDEPGWLELTRGVSKEVRTLVHLETEATSIVNFEPLLVPGLMQTADYARALMKAGGLTDAEAEQRVAARLARQAILSRDEPPKLRLIIDEMVLRRPLGGPRVMARQLRHLVDTVQAPNVTVRVVPFAVGAHTGLDGSFVIMDFARHNAVVNLEHKLSSVFLERPDEVALFRREADRLEALSLSPDESLDFVARVATEHDRE
jgi:transcriptional regulator with XRE-family HTH domain